LYEKNETKGNDRHPIKMRIQSIKEIILPASSLSKLINSDVVANKMDSWHWRSNLR
jgi:hypothetical protein